MTLSYIMISKCVVATRLCGHITIHSPNAHSPHFTHRGRALHTLRWHEVVRAERRCCERLHSCREGEALLVARARHRGRLPCRSGAWRLAFYATRAPLFVRTPICLPSVALLCMHLDQASIMVTKFLKPGDPCPWAGISCLVSTAVILVAAFVQRIGALHTVSKRSQVLSIKVTAAPSGGSASSMHRFFPVDTSRRRHATTRLGLLDSIIHDGNTMLIMP